MENLKIVTGESINLINRKIRQALSKGDIIRSIYMKDTNDLRAKITHTLIDDIQYYGMWEKDLLEGKWHLLHYGDKREVFPEWNNYIDFFKNCGENTIRMIA